MKLIEQNIGNLLIVMPNSWKMIESEDIISLYNQNGVGAINISRFKVPKDYFIDVREELNNYIVESLEDDSVKNIKELESNQCLIISFVETKSQFWVIKIITKEQSIAFITYNCDIKDKDVEIEIVKEILDSVKYK